MRATLLGADAPEWAAALRTTVHDFYHLPAYAALCARHEEGTAAALHVVDGERALLLPLVLRDIAGGGSDALSPYGYPGPIVHGTDDPAFVRAALEAGCPVLGEAGVVSLFVRLHPLLDPSPPEGIGTLVRHGDTVSIDLTLPAEVSWAQMRSNHRRDIARSLKLGWVASIDDAWLRFDEFVHLYRATMDRRAAAPFYRFTDAYFAGLRETLGDRLRLCVVEREGELGAAGLFVETGGIVGYHLSGTAEGAIAVQPTKLMMLFMGGWAKARGDTVLHLGGGVGGADDALFHFKAGFGPRRHPFHTLRIVLDEPAYRRLVHEHDPRLDPDDRRGYFPAYRRP